MRVGAQVGPEPVLFGYWMASSRIPVCRWPLNCNCEIALVLGYLGVNAIKGRSGKYIIVAVGLMLSS